MEDCKNHFNEINTDELNMGRKFARAKYTIWSCYHPETNLWVEFPIKLNVEIEDAYQKRLTV